MKFIRGLFVPVAILFTLMFSGHALGKDRVTILYDAFSDNKAVTKDWGFSALVEHDGKRILFDAGNNAATFEHNVKALGVDLSKLDFVVVSHRHTDHTTGLKYLQRLAAVFPSARRIVLQCIARRSSGTLPVNRPLLCHQ